jgi:hypothetical protein
MALSNLMARHSVINRGLRGGSWKVEDDHADG